MSAMNKTFLARPGRLLAAALSLLALGACSALSPTATPPPAFYSLDSAPVTAPAPARTAAPTLIINPPRAAD
jgi:cholesterol transport system auxiliary component